MTTQQPEWKLHAVRARERADRLDEMARTAKREAMERPHDGVLRELARSLARRADAAEREALTAEEHAR